MGAAAPAEAAPNGVDIVLDGADDPAWRALLSPADPETCVREAILAALAGAGHAAARTEVSVTLAEDAAVRELNREWRGKDKPTNILSFPMVQLAPGDSLGPLLGDLVLARETLEREATVERKTALDHFRHLLVHGTLHLAGFDHETDEEAERMEALEIEILRGLGISDPYAETVE
ncbi:rRNA maturation RNase YbeY [Aureimonas sp. AU4]|uniref:rRNA maturation RNase YbeY n=1 Tax=Aureimonas sp. AU4 TaxID=1638163 RepID=UPI0007821131|nr:rRNA maturation RNase YbeY [Aureimonas sp. AU4]